MIKNRKKGILLVLCSALLVCIGQLLWKLSATGGLWLLLGGFVFYGIGAVLMILAYRYGELSVLQPMLSINYALSIILGVIVLQEAVTMPKIAGICIISFGVILIGGSSRED